MAHQHAVEIPQANRAVVLKLVAEFTILRQKVHYHDVFQPEGRFDGDVRNLLGLRRHLHRGTGKQ